MAKQHVAYTAQLFDTIKIGTVVHLFDRLASRTVEKDVSGLP
jgi:hypothetical protein